MDAEFLNKEKIYLGRQLFYDPILSLDSSISCASCHSPFNAFAHSDHKLSHGIFDSILQRNAPALFNLAWQDKFMWDGAVNHLDMQALVPLTNKNEMAENLENILVKLKRQKKYQSAFKQVFGQGEITIPKVLKAISAFEFSLISSNSKYDSVKNKLTQFSMQEKKGYNLFLKHCNRCHTEPLFTNYSFANNGLDMDSTLYDIGRVKISLNEKDSFLFKVPSLRNLSYTYPYMHDGRFKNLAQVLEHYTNGISHASSLDKGLKNGINISSNDRVDIIAFILCLNDKKFVQDTSHSFIK